MVHKKGYNQKGEYIIIIVVLSFYILLYHIYKNTIEKSTMKHMQCTNQETEGWR